MTDDKKTKKTVKKATKKTTKAKPKAASMTKKEFEGALDQFEVAEPETLDHKMDFVLSQARAEDPAYADSNFEQGVQPPAIFNMTFFTLRRMALPVMVLALFVMGALIVMRGGLSIDQGDQPVQVAQQQDIEPIVYDSDFETHIVAFETDEVLSDTIDQDIILLEMAMLDVSEDGSIFNDEPADDTADDDDTSDEIEDFLDELFGPETSQL